jgi:hypothetical protein
MTLLSKEKESTSTKQNEGDTTTFKSIARQVKTRRQQPVTRRDDTASFALSQQSRDQPPSEKSKNTIQKEETGFELHLRCSSTGKKSTTVALAENDFLNSPPPLQTRKAKLKRFFTRRKKMDVITTVDQDDSFVVGTVATVVVDKGTVATVVADKIDDSLADKIDDSLWSELFEAAQTLVRQFMGQTATLKKSTYPAEIDNAISIFRQHAKRLGLEERELMQAIQKDERSIKTGYVTDDGTLVTYSTGYTTDDRSLVTYSTGFQTNAMTEDDAATSSDAGTIRTTADNTLRPEDDFTTYTEYRNDHPVVMKVLDVFDYYFAGYST